MDQWDQLQESESFSAVNIRWDIKQTETKVPGWQKLTHSNGRGFRNNHASFQQGKTWRSIKDKLETSSRRAILTHCSQKLAGWEQGIQYPFSIAGCEDSSLALLPIPISHQYIPGEAKSSSGADVSVAHMQVRIESLAPDLDLPHPSFWRPMEQRTSREERCNCLFISVSLSNKVNRDLIDKKTNSSKRYWHLNKTFNTFGLICFKAMEKNLQKPIT